MSEDYGVIYQGQKRTAWVSEDGGKYLLIQLDVLHRFQGESKVTQHGVDAEQTKDAEVSKEAV